MNQFFFLSAGKCCKSLVIKSSGLAGNQNPNIMGAYAYDHKDSNGYNVFKGPNNNKLYHVQDVSAWFVSWFNEI